MRRAFGGKNLASRQGLGTSHATAFFGPRTRISRVFQGPGGWLPSASRDNGQRPARAHLAEGLTRGLGTQAATPRDSRLAGPIKRFFAGPLGPQRRGRRPKPTLKTVDNAPSWFRPRGHGKRISERQWERLAPHSCLLFGAFGVLPERFHLFESCLFGGAALGVKTGFDQLETPHKFRIGPT